MHTLTRFCHKHSKTQYVLHVGQVTVHSRFALSIMLALVQFDSRDSLAIVCSTQQHHELDGITCLPKRSVVCDILATLLKKDVHFFHYLPVPSLRERIELDGFNQYHHSRGVWQCSGVHDHDNMIDHMVPASGKRP